MDKTALRPSFFNNLPTVVRQEEAKKKGVTEEEGELYALSQSDGWRQLREYTESLLKDLDTGTATAMAQGLPFEEIGRNAVVIDLAKGIIRNIINKVEDTREAVDGTDK